MNTNIIKQTKQFIENGWEWKKVKGLGTVLTSPNGETYPMKQIEKSIYIPEFIKINNDNTN